MTSKIEEIQFPFPEEATEKVDNIFEETEKNITEAVNTPDTKSADLYEGLPLPIMVNEWGLEKTLEYVNASVDIYKSMGMRKQARKLASTTKKYTKEYIAANTQEKKKTAKAKAKEMAISASEKLKENADKAIAKADKIDKKLSGFTNNRRIEIKALVQTINDLPDRDTFENFVVNFFIGKVEDKIKSSSVGTKINNSLKEKVEKKVLPLQDIISWAEELFALYNSAKGISLDSVVSVVTSLVTLQFQPYISKYNQYVRTVNDLKMLIQEYTVIIDAVNSKAQEYGSPITVQVPTLPDLPDLPEIPV